MVEDTTRLFVGQLPIDITDEEIRLIFNTYGKVVDVNIIDGKPPGTQKCAFVAYDAPEGGQAAMQVLHEVYKFRPDADKPIRVNTAKPRVKGESKGAGGGAGNYASPPSYGGFAQSALPGGSFGGFGPGAVVPYGGYTQQGPVVPLAQNFDSGVEDARKLFVGQLPMDISEDEVLIVFKTYGMVTDVKIIDGKPPGSQKCAFVSYETEDGGRAACQVLHEVYKFRPSSISPIRVNIARPKFAGKGDSGKGGGGGYGGGAVDSYGGGSHGSYDQGKGKGQGYRAPEPGPKLYVANLPGDIQKEALHTVFSTYGSLTDVHVMAGRSHTGHAAAFVSYGNEADASVAVSAMEQGYEIRPGQGNILVSFAKGGGKGPPPPRSTPY